MFNVRVRYFFTCGPDWCISKRKRRREPQERNSAVKKLLGNFLRIMRTDIPFFAYTDLSKYIVIALLTMKPDRTAEILLDVLKQLRQALENLNWPTLDSVIPSCE
jgi:hypothetical protein